jgi:hypothetical protein
METLEQLDPVEEASSYTLKVCSTLLSMAYIHEIDPDDLVEFFSTQVQAMLTVPSNYKQFGHAPPVWVMRGFYPGTRLFFKLVIARNEKGTWAKASIPMMHVGSKRKADRFIKLTGKELNQSMVKKMENSLLGADHQIVPLIPDKVRRMPRCMSPKGVKIFSCDIPRTKKCIPDPKIPTDSSQL